MLRIDVANLLLSPHLHLLKALATMKLQVELDNEKSLNSNVTLSLKHSSGMELMSQCNSHMNNLLFLSTP